MAITYSYSQVLNDSFNPADHAINVNVINDVITVSGGSSGGATSGIIRGTLTDHSGETTAADTVVTVMEANSNRCYLFIQNISGNHLYIDFTVDADRGGNTVVRIPAGGTFIQDGSGFVTTEKITLVGVASGQVFCAKEG